MAVEDITLPKSDAKTSAVEEQMINVGGHFLYMRASGEGSPTVVIESGLGGGTAAYGWLEQEIAKFTRVVLYDRAGLGRSEASKKKMRFLDAVPQLHTLLEKAGEKGPFVLVGHSMGGIMIRQYTRLYHDEVAGLVFIDSSHPQQIEKMPPSLARQNKILMQILKVKPVAKFLLMRASKKDIQVLPPDRIEDGFAEFSSDKHFQATRDEYQDSQTFMKVSQSLGGLGDLPIAVFSASEPKGEFMTVWHDLQRQIAALSSNSKHQIVKGAKHVSLVSERENALLVVAGVREMVEEIRSAESKPAS